MNLFEVFKNNWARDNEYKEHSTAMTYYNHIDKFVKYLEQEGKDNQPLAVNIEDVIKSIGYYNKIGDMDSIATMKLHVNSINVFYEYLQSKQLTSNIFDKGFDVTEFYKQMANKFGLLEPKESEFLEYNQILEILKSLELGILSKSYLDLSEREKKRYLRDLTVCLFVKISIIYPAKRQDICNIQVGQFQEDYRILRVNNRYTSGLNLKIPRGFRNELKKFITQREVEIGRRVCKDELIFNFLVGEVYTRPEDINTCLYYFLKRNEIVDFPKGRESCGTEIIRNTLLPRMIKQGTNPKLISQISNLSVNQLLKKCYREELENEQEIEKIINLEIRKIGLTDEM